MLELARVVLTPVIDGLAGAAETIEAFTAGLLVVVGLAVLVYMAVAVAPR